MNREVQARFLAVQLTAIFAKDSAEIARGTAPPAGSSSSLARSSGDDGAASSQPPSLSRLAFPVLLMCRLLRDAEQGRDLLPAPAKFARAAYLQLLDRVQQRAQGSDPAPPDLRILARCLRHDLTRLDHLRQDSLTSHRRQDLLTAAGTSRKPSRRCSDTTEGPRPRVKDR